MQIEIPELLLKRLQKHMTPYVDNYVSVIERWADLHDQHDQKKVDLKADSITANAKHAPMEIPPGVQQFDPKRPPSLLHTRVRGEFAAKSFSNWNDLLRVAHIHAFKDVRSFEELHKMTRAQIRKGSYSNEGYKFVPEIGISIQGVDADHAWPYALRLAIHLKVPVKAEIEWRNNDKAAHPGERGVIVWTP